MGTRAASPAPSGLTERQQKWFASVKAGLERDTGKSLEAWVAIARTCPETKPRARSAWLKEHHGLGINRAAQVLSAAFPSEGMWEDGDSLRAALWTEPGGLAILEAVEASIGELDGVVHGQRKGFSAWSRKVQFAALKPIRGGGAWLGLGVSSDADPRLLAPKNEGWSERLGAKLRLDGPGDVDDRVRRLLRTAWEAA